MASLFIIPYLSLSLSSVLSTVIILTFEPPPQPSPAGRGSIRKLQIMPVRSVALQFQVSDEHYSSFQYSSRFWKGSDEIAPGSVKGKL